MVSIFKRAFEESHGGRGGCLGCDSQHDSLAILPATFFDHRKAARSPSHTSKTYWQIHQLAGGGFKGRIEQKERVTSRYVPSRVAAVSCLHPEHRSWCIAAPLEVAWSCGYSIVNVWN